MAELRYVDRAQYSPTQCAICQTHEGPFIDTSVEFIGYGHVYICASHSGRSGCVRQMANFDGMVSVETFDEIAAENAVLGERVRDLEAELDESRVVPLSEVLAYVASERAARFDPVPVAKETV